MVNAVAALLLVRQNPNPPYVLLPPDWRVDYSRMNRDRTASLVGPKGEAIGFPAYGGDGDRAAELRGSDPKGVFVHALLDGRKVDVAIARDGRLAVSYPQAWPPTHASFSAFDYWAKVRTAREAAGDLLLVLTRVEAYKGQGYGGGRTSPPPSPTVPFFLNYWTGVPLGWMSTPLGYSGRKGAPGDATLGKFESVGRPTVEAYLPGAEGAPRLADPASPHRWEETRTLLGRAFHIAEGERGGLAAWVTLPPGSEPKGIGPVFTTQEASPRAAVVLVLMRLSFDRLES